MHLRPHDAFLKLARADEHLDSLYAQIETWSATHPYRITHERDPKSGFTVVYFKPLSEPPSSLSLILGDAIQNLRACLDYLTLALSERGYGRPMSEGMENSSQFPICRTETQFAQALRSIIPHIDAGPSAVIKSVQPYHRGHDWDCHPLAILKTLSNFDKHRRLPLVANSPRVDATPALVAQWRFAEFSLILPSWTGQKAELFRCPDSVDCRVDVDFSLTLDVAFANGAPDPLKSERVRAVAETLWMYVGREVVLPMKSYLK